MDRERALNIARGCILSSGLPQSKKTEVLDCLNGIDVDVTSIVDGTCLDCGQELAEDWDYCPGCGKRLMKQSRERMRQQQMPAEEFTQKVREYTEGNQVDTGAVARYFGVGIMEARARALELGLIEW